jgi:cation diffusion facilitator family transporter
VIPLPASETSRLTLVAVGSIAVAVLVMGIKYVAYLRTGSVALYSDALESIVNLITAVAALVAIRVSLRPADRSHPFGHHKAELVAAVLEGALIVVAAVMIIAEAIAALSAGRAVERPWEGLLISAAATAVNGAWAGVLLAGGRTWRSPALTADGWHLLSDVLTSIGVIAGVALVAITGWRALDALIAMAVALYILVAGWRIALRSMSGLMDEAASPEIQARIRAQIAANGGGALQAHDIRTRHAGRVTFIEFHLVVPGTMTVADAHAICDRLEDALRTGIAGAQVTIHVEPEEKAKAGAVQL